jgi:chromosome segregation ATPase
METEDLKTKIKTLYDTINNLKDSLNLKNDQLNTMQSTLNLKDEQIKTLENSLKLKEEKIDTLEKTVKLREEEIKSTADSTVDKVLIDEKEKKIEDLQKEIEILNDELSKSDEEIEQLELENEKLKEASSSSSDSKIIDFSNIVISKSEIIEKMREILQKALHSVTIVVPTITDLQDLYLYEVRSSVNMKISCEINPGIEENTELLDEYESLDNISLRNFEGSDRYVIIRDGEELLLSVIGKSEDNHLVFHTSDSAHIKLLNSLTMEAWLRSRRI